MIKGVLSEESIYISNYIIGYNNLEGETCTIVVGLNIQVQMCNSNCIYVLIDLMTNNIPEIHREVEVNLPSLLFQSL